MDLFIFICRFRFARQDLAWVYPVFRFRFRFRVNAFSFIIIYYLIPYCTGTCGGGWSAGAEFRAVFYLFILVFLCVRCWGPRC